MKWTTGVSHLEQLADSCTEMLPASDVIGFRVTELWAFGSVLDERADLDWVHVAAAVDLPAEEVPWLGEPPGSAFWASRTRLDKNPVSVRWRSTRAPVWNHAIVRPLLVWDADAGKRDEVLAAVRDGAAGPLRQPLPSPHELRTRLQAELEVSLGELKRRTAHYTDKRWGRARLEHIADPLWTAADGYLDVLKALGQPTSALPVHPGGERDADDRPLG